MAEANNVILTRILRAALYERVSSEEQALRGFSIETQIDNLTEFCQKNSYKIVDHYTDEGISGAKPPLKRPALTMCKVEKSILFSSRSLIVGSAPCQNTSRYRRFSMHIMSNGRPFMKIMIQLPQMVVWRLRSSWRLLKMNAKRLVNASKQYTHTSSRIKRHASVESHHSDI